MASSSPHDVVEASSGLPEPRAPSTIPLIPNPQPRLKIVPPTRFKAYPLETIYGELLEKLIGFKLIVHAARKDNLANDKQYKEQMANIGEKILRQLYVERRFRREITEALLRQRYDEEIKSLPPRDEIKARNILVDSEETARAIIEEIKAGADFATVAKEKSKGRKADEGGALGYRTRDEMLPEFSDAAFALRIGSISEEPVKSAYGWHVIMVEDRRIARPPTFDEFRNRLQAQLSNEIYADMVHELTTKFTVERFNLDGTPMAK